MFEIEESPSYFWPVKFKRPMDGGKFNDVSFDVKFTALSRSKNSEMFNGPNALDVDICKAIVIDWKGITVRGQEIQFSQTNLDKLLEVPGAAFAIVRAYSESISGAKIKN